jgi:hypothetical protein
VKRRARVDRREFKSPRCTFGAQGTRLRFNWDGPMVVAHENPVISAQLWSSAYVQTLLRVRDRQSGYLSYLVSQFVRRL